MIDTLFSAGDTWLDRDGDTVEITHVDPSGAYPVHGYYMLGKEKSFESWTASGFYLDHKNESNMDLIQPKD